MRLNNWVFALLFLTSGLALILYIVFHLPILFGFLVNFLLLACLAFLHLRKRTPEERKHFHHLVRTGLIAGISSTVVYDVSRLVLVKLTGIIFWPFDIFNILVTHCLAHIFLAGSRLLQG